MYLCCHASPSLSCKRPYSPSPWRSPTILLGHQSKCDVVFSSTRVRLKPQWNGMRRLRRGTVPRGEEVCRRRSARSLRPRCSRCSSNSTNTRSLGPPKPKPPRLRLDPAANQCLTHKPVNVNRIPDLPTAMMLLLEHPGVESERTLSSWNLVWFGSNCANRFSRGVLLTRLSTRAKQMLGDLELPPGISTALLPVVRDIQVPPSSSPSHFWRSVCQSFDCQEPSPGPVPLGAQPCQLSLRLSLHPMDEDAAGASSGRQARDRVGVLVSPRRCEAKN